MAIDDVELRAVRTWYHFDVTLPVRQWVLHPETNHGLIIRGYGDVSIEYRLLSSGWVQVGLRPQLVIFYETEPDGWLSASGPSSVPQTGGLGTGTGKGSVIAFGVLVVVILGYAVWYRRTRRAR